MSDTAALPLKVQCPHCRTKLDLSELEPFSEIACPKCGTAVVVPQWFQSILLEEVLLSSPGLRVYRALDPTLDREACVKQLWVPAASHPPAADPDNPYQAETLEEFLGVFRRTSLLMHPNIVPVCSCGSLSGLVYTVTQYVNGQALNQANPHGVPDWPEILQIFSAVCDGLSHAAGKEIYHGHLTPENILLDQDGVPRLTDFSVALAIGKDIQDSPYICPEFIPGSRTGSVSGDIFSLGVCIYEYATGVLPCAGREAAWRGGEMVPAPLSTFNPAVPKLFSDLVLQMLSLTPAQRPASYETIQSVCKRLSLSPEATQRRKKGRAGGLKIKRPAAHRPVRLVRPARNSGGKVINIMIILLILLALVLLVLIGQKHYGSKTLGGVDLQAESEARAKVLEESEAELRELDLLRAEEAKSQFPATDNPEFKPCQLDEAMLAARPRPEDFDFRRVREELKGYMALIPEESKEQERERIRIIASYKEYLVSKMRKLTYQPDNYTGLQLRNGRRVKGTLTLFSDTEVLKLRQPGVKSGVFLEIPWKDVALQEVLDMAFYYVRRSHDEIRGVKVISRKRLQEVVDEYIYLIMLCDWYQETAYLDKVCREAVTLPDPNIQARIRHFVQWSEQ